MRSRDQKDEAPELAGDGGSKVQRTADSTNSAGAGQAKQAAVCKGCDKPFTAARKVRGTFTMAFHHFPTGRVGTQPVSLCGKCAAYAKHNRPYDLPGIAREAQRLEVLVAAEPTGVLQ